MKKRIFSIVSIAALIALPMSVAAQVTSSTSNASNMTFAKIISPITVTLTNGTTMNFGTITKPTDASASVTIDPSSGDLTKGGAGTLYLVQSGDAHYIASAVPTFDVTGEGTYGYTVTLPTSITLNAGSSSMTVNSFTTNLTDNKGTLDATGKSQFAVGATLNIIKDQPSGDYAGKFDVTVTYN